MDIIFDIDGTLADAKHRVHLINDPANWVVVNGKPPRPDWGGFLDNEMVAQDIPIPQTWAIMRSLLINHARICFITGRPDSQRDMTWSWLTEMSCPIRYALSGYLNSYDYGRDQPKHRLLMRTSGDHRPSDVVKGELLQEARSLGYVPTMAFEDRIQDTAMWRREGLLYLQVAEGNY